MGTDLRLVATDVESIPLCNYQLSPCFGARSFYRHAHGFQAKFPRWTTLELSIAVCGDLPGHWLPTFALRRFRAPSAHPPTSKESQCRLIFHSEPVVRSWFPRKMLVLAEAQSSSQSEGSNLHLIARGRLEIPGARTVLAYGQVVIAGCSSKSSLSDHPQPSERVAFRSLQPAGLGQNRFRSICEMSDVLSRKSRGRKHRGHIVFLAASIVK